MNKIFYTLLTFILFTLTIQAQTFTLRSADLGGQMTNKQVFKGFGCEGENISPQLSWENAPEGTKSFAITIHDPDAPTGSGWWHWLAFDIPADATTLESGAGTKEGMMPDGCIQSLTDFGKGGYGGPCPPEGHGFHTYITTVYALNTDKLGLGADANPALVGFYLNSTTIEKATIVAYYKRE